MRSKWAAKERVNDATFENDEEVDEAQRSRAGGAPMVRKVDGEEGVSTGVDLRPVITASTQMMPGRGV